MNKVELTLNDQLLILFAVSDRIDRYQDLINRFPGEKHLVKTLEEYVSLKVKINNVFKGVTPE